MQLLLAWLHQTEQPLRGCRSIWNALHGLRNAKRSQAVDGVAGLIGNTPLVRIQSLSELTGCEVAFWACLLVKDMHGTAVAGQHETGSSTLVTLLLLKGCDFMTWVFCWQWRGNDGMEAHSGLLLIPHSRKENCARELCLLRRKILSKALILSLGA